MMKRRLSWENWRTFISIFRRRKWKVFETEKHMPYFRNRRISETMRGRVIKTEVKKIGRSCPRESCRHR